MDRSIMGDQIHHQVNNDASPTYILSAALSHILGLQQIKKASAFLSLKQPLKWMPNAVDSEFISTELDKTLMHTKHLCSIYVALAAYIRGNFWL